MILPKHDEMFMTPGAYRLGTFQVNVISDTMAAITCDRCGKQELNEVVSIGWLERKRGVSLEDKTKKRVRELKEMMTAHNAELKRRRDMERRIRATFWGG
ncbi:hypothetical protein E2R60_05085 [Paenibacillus dendritiformis]|uniref:hypothetical protein n=1 Tax=Paenibacillus dendritiformis TaxID=130049 RepID=UPI00105A155F|nr:hypothetical protein [Paenibacillus dendritiformis]TDL57853.1 hypothetical protein E2R60_05085 [Paenibacillus dendritiformis]